MLEYLIYPQCICCNKTVIKRRFGLCESCFQKLISINFNSRCKYCSYPLSEGSNICGRCFNSRNFFDKGFFLLPYNDCVKALIHSIKFGDGIEFLNIVDEFKDDIVDFVNKNSIDYITYVPSSLFHFLSRGYTVPKVLAEKVSHITGIKWGKLVYTKYPYKRLLSKSTNARERKSIVKNFFIVKSNTVFDSVLIVDDVFTTGTTINEISKMLKRAGITKKVCFLTIAMVV